jgi:pectinesterase
MASRLAPVILIAKSTALAALFIVATPVFAQGYQTELSVALDGTGDFSSIQGAIDATRSFPGKRITIRIKNGVYREKVEVFAWNTMVSLVGESREGTVITFDDSFNKIGRGRNSTFHTYTLKVRGNDFHAENLTIVNSSGPVGQAVALHVDADRASFVNVSVKGFQDTLYVAGDGFRSYFKNCLIEGSTDFIFGGGTALFENCEIRSLSNSYITAASTAKGQPFGLVFKHCRLTAAPDVGEVYLGRPWRGHARAVFISSELGGHIVGQGWHNWDNEANETTAFFAEFENRGPGSSTGHRVPWSKQLSKEAAAAYTLEGVFGDWNPATSHAQNT